MKRAAALILAFVILCTAVSCSGNTPDDSSTAYESTDTPHTDVQETEIVTVPDVTEEQSQDTWVAAETDANVALPEDYAGIVNADPASYVSLNPAANQTVIIYDFNGGEAGSAFGKTGIVTDTATGKITLKKYNGYFAQIVTDSEYICPHSMGNQEFLKREGYVLYGYNTKPDGSGDYYGCGWNVPIQIGEKIVLYAQWAKESPDSDFKFDGTKLVAYRTNLSRVVVPEGTTEILEGAFKNKTDLEYVILPSSMTAIADGAFKNCKKLRAVYMYDKVTVMTGDSFEECDLLDSFKINNATGIKYMGTNKQSSYMQKLARLIVMKDKKKIVLIGGSNLCYGLDSAALKAALDGEYEIINFGTMYYSPAAFFVDLTSEFLIPGDIVVTCPEEEPWQWGQVWNNGKFNYGSYLMWYCEGCMEAFSYVDMRIYRDVLSDIAAANAQRADGAKSYESVNSESVNQYGDFDYVRTAQTARKKTTTGEGGTKIPSGWANTSYYDWYGADSRARYFTSDNVKNLNRAFDICKSRGALVFISFSPCDKMYVKDYSTATLEAYEQAAIDNFVTGHTGTYLISKVSDYVLEDKYFYNSMHHLLTEGAGIRTQQLIKDIKTQLEKIPK